MNTRLLRYSAVLSCALAVATFAHVPARVTAAGVPALNAYSVPAGMDSTSSAADSLTGHTFVAGDGQVAMVDTSTGIVLRRVSIGLGYPRIYIDSGHGRALIYSNGGAGTASVSTLDAATGRLIRTVNLDTVGLAGPIALDQTTGRLFVGDWRTGDRAFAVSMIDTSSGTLMRRWTDPNTSYTAFMAVDESYGRLLVLADQYAGNASSDTFKLTVMDSRTGDVVATQLLQIPSEKQIAPIFMTDSAAGQVLISEQGGLAVRDISDGSLLSTLNVTPDLVLADDPNSTVVALQGNTLYLFDQISGTLLNTVSLPQLAGYDASSGAAPVAIDSQTGRIYALVRNSAGRLQLQVLDGANGTTIDSIDLRQPAGSAVVAVDAAHQRLAIVAQAGGGQAGVFIDVDSGSDTLVARGSTPCSKGGLYSGWSATIDPNTGRLYCIDPGSDSTNGTPAAYMWDLVTGQAWPPFTLGSNPQAAQPIGTSGYVLVPQDSTATIIGPARRNPASPVPPACCGAQYFPHARHNLRGAFLTFWRRYGGVDTFGYPQTEPFVEDGRTVQYTDRFVLEMVNGRVQTAPLARYLVTQEYFDPLSTQGLAPGARYFPSTQHSLSGRFLSWWQTHRGSALLGAPISEQVVEQNGDGSGRSYLLQWFERGRLEYHPENAGTRYEMQLGLVGLQALQQRGWKS